MTIQLLYNKKERYYEYDLIDYKGKLETHRPFEEYQFITDLITDQFIWMGYKHMCYGHKLTFRWLIFGRITFGPPNRLFKLDHILGGGYTGKTYIQDLTGPRYNMLLYDKKCQYDLNHFCVYKYILS